MSLKCPKCDSTFPKAQKYVIPYSICDWGTLLKFRKPGKREDANMFCTECNSNFLATKNSYQKITRIHFLLSVFLILILILSATVFASLVPNKIFFFMVAASGLIRLFTPRILNNIYTELEEADLKDVSKVSFF